MTEYYGISDAVKSLFARLEKTEAGKLERDLSMIPENLRMGHHGTEYLGFTIPGQESIQIIVSKKLVPDCDTRKIELQMASSRIKEENIRYGITDDNSDQKANCMSFSVADGPMIGHLKSLIARELDHSENPRLRELGQQFVRELKGQSPIPPFARSAAQTFADVQPK